MWWGMIIVLASLFSFPLEGACAEEMATIGAVEEVILLPWNIKILARIDTGAATTSLDVREMIRHGEKEVEFVLPERCGGHQMRLPVLQWRSIKSSEGFRERRPVVELEICLGPKRLRTQVTLNDRSSMEFPLIIGRKTIRRNFVVDVSRSNITSPVCH